MDCEASRDIPPQKTYPFVLRKLADDKPEKLAYIFFDVRLNKIELTRRDIWDYSRKYAAILKRHGIQKGDIVCNTLVNSPERLLTALGTVVAGAMSMHGQLFLADGEDLIHNCKVAKCRAIIVDPSQEKGAWTILKRIQFTDPKTSEIRFTGLPDLIKVLPVRVCPSKEHQRGLHDLRLESQMFEEPEIREEDTAFIFLTSGTTGFSKLFPHSHRNCLTRGKFPIPFGFQRTDEVNVFSSKSLGWIGGYPCMYMATGCTRVLIDDSLGVPQRMDLLTYGILNQVEINYASLSIPLVDSLTRLVSSGQRLKKRCQVVVTGGTLVSKRMLNAIGVITDYIGNQYGLTEWRGFSVYWVKQGSKYKDYCVGIPSEEWQFQILDDKNQELPHGQIGQVAIRGPLDTSGYLNDPEMTKKLISEDGALMPDDLGYKDEEGHLYLIGRANDAIHRGSFIHYPGWLEARIQRYPGVQVRMVFGGLKNDTDGLTYCVLFIN